MHARRTWVVPLRHREPSALTSAAIVLGGLAAAVVTWQFDDAEKIESLDLPYHATAFPIILPGGTEKLVSGVADKELAGSYARALA